MMQIPVVDLSKLLGVESAGEQLAEWKSAAAKIREGLGTAGFLYLVNHGVPHELISDVFSKSREFFDLDSNVKLKYKKGLILSSKDAEKTENSNTMDMDDYCGYTPAGGERLHPNAKLELKESYDWLDGRGYYPDTEIPQFNSNLAHLDKACKNLVKKLLKLVAISLDLEDVEFFVKCCRHLDDSKNHVGIYNMRVLHYPPIHPDDDRAKIEGAVRCGEHSDYGLLTLLFQDDVGGLQVKSVDGEWVDAKPIPGSILINTGDLIEFWTSGIFPATPHRVNVPESVLDVRRSKSRYSVVFFNGPDKDTIVTPLNIIKNSKEQERLEKCGNQKVYSEDPINASDYMMGRCANQYT